MVFGSSSIWTSLARLGQWRIIGVTLQLGWALAEIIDTISTVNFYKWLQLLQEITLCTEKTCVYLSGGTCDDKTYKSCESVGTTMFKTRCKFRTNTLIIMSATNTWLSKVVGAWTHATSCNIISFNYGEPGQFGLWTWRNFTFWYFNDFSIWEHLKIVYTT